MEREGRGREGKIAEDEREERKLEVRRGREVI